MLNKYLVEFLGTLFALYIVLLSKANPIAIGAAFALAIYLGKSISGGNFNPAISFMLFSDGKLRGSDLLGYVLAQVLGGLAALKLYKYVKY